MRTVLRVGRPGIAVLVGMGVCGVLAAQAKPEKAKEAAAAAKTAGGIHVPVEYHKLPNGLKVVLSPDHTSPKVVVAVYYGIGFRIEPKDRTGFAHLFEHMMFQGSQNLGKMEFIKLVQSNGGILNGSTRFDFTNYFEIVPSHTLEMALWAEADRMKGLAINQDNLTNQQGVVKSRGPGQRLEPSLRRLPLARHAAVREHQLVQLPQLLRRSEGPRCRDPFRRAGFLQDLLRPQQRGDGGHRRLRLEADARLDHEVLRRHPFPEASAAARHLRAEAGAGEARDQARPARDEAGPRVLVPRAAARHSRVLRDGGPRRDPRGGQGQPALPGSRPEARLHRRGQRRDQRARQHVRHQGPGPLHRLPVPRQGQVRRRDPEGRGRGDREAARGAGGQGDARARDGQDPLGPLRQHRPALRFRKGRPARLLRALRRRPGQDQRARSGVPQGHPGADPEDGPRVPAARPTGPSS